MKKYLEESHFLEKIIQFYLKNNDNLYVILKKKNDFLSKSIIITLILLLFIPFQTI